MDTLDISRRGWLRGAGLTTLGLAAAPSAALAQAPSAAAEPAVLWLNENPWGISPAAHQAMIDHLPRISRYPDVETRLLRDAIARQEGVSPDMVVIAPGSSPILRTLGDLFASEKPGGELITGAATFEVQYRAVAARGGKVVHVPFDSAMRYDLDAMAARLGPDTCGVYICNPNNPTGTAVEPAKLRAFALEASKIAPVFVDEAYIDMTDDYPASSMIDLTRAGHNVIVCRTFSKLHGLAAARCGYAILPAATAAKVRSTLSSGGLPRLGVVAALASLADTGNQALMKARLKAGRLKLEAMADGLGLTYARNSQANFIYLKHGMKNADFVTAMRAQGVLVVQRAFPGFEDWNRICVGKDDEIARCQAALKVVLKRA